jgi:hypothetical protein
MFDLSKGKGWTPETSYIVTTIIDSKIEMGKDHNGLYGRIF